MVKVKICGLKSFEDIEYVNKLKPDYIGIVFAPSKRRVEVEQAKHMIALLRKDIKTVGVFVNEDIEKVKAIAETTGLQILQFHGTENYEYIEQFKHYEVWKALKINDKFNFNTMNYELCSKFLLDNSIPGSGVAFDWKLVEEKVKCEQIILAGGLTIDNVKQGINTLKPYGVDVSSGVETDGKKDYNKIKEFIRKARELY
jgi:phosphoribosylanthranilate isomerase